MFWQQLSAFHRAFTLPPWSLFLTLVTVVDLNRLEIIKPHTGNPASFPDLVSSWAKSRNLVLWVCWTFIVPYWILHLILILMDKCSYHPLSRILFYPANGNYHRNQQLNLTQKSMDHGNSAPIDAFTEKLLYRWLREHWGREDVENQNTKTSIMKQSNLEITT